MQIQISSIKNGFLIASQTPITEEMQKMYEHAQLVEIAKQPVVRFCEDYRETCEYIKQFFFDGKEIS